MSMLDQGGKVTWIKSRDLLASGEVVTGLVTEVTEREFKTFHGDPEFTRPKDGNPGRPKNELLVTIESGEDKYVFNAKEFSDRHKKIRAAASKAGIKVGDSVGHEIAVSVEGRGEPVGGDSDKAAYLHKVELSE